MEWFISLAGGVSSVVVPRAISFFIDIFSRDLSHRYSSGSHFNFILSLRHCCGFVWMCRDEAYCFF